MSCQELSCVLQTEISPVFTKNGVSNVLRTIFHRRICCHVIFQHLEIIIHCLDIRITCPLKNSYLNPESFVVMSGSCALTHGISKGIDPVDMSIRLTELIPFFLCKPCIPELRVLINIIIKRYKRFRVYQLTHIITIYKIRILPTCNQSTGCFGCRLSGKPCFFHLHTPLIRDHLGNFIVTVDL